MGGGAWSLSDELPGLNTCNTSRHLVQDGLRLAYSLTEFTALFFVLSLLFLLTYFFHLFGR